MPEEIRFNSRTERYEWLSNFHHSPIWFGDRTWTCAEALYQAHKCTTTSEAFSFHTLNCWQAKAKGKEVRCKPNWDQIKLRVMRRVLRLKFTQSPTLRLMLLDTGDAKLVHEAPWDRYWGTGRDGRGEDHLGKLLMELRSELKKEAEDGREYDD